jgi:hypothetical protein
MPKKLLATTIILATIILATILASVVSIYGVEVVNANPYTITGEVPPDQETYPPVITVTSPVNNTAYNTSRLSLTFNVTALQSRTAWEPVTLMKVTYKADWYKEAINVLNGGGQQQASFSLQFSNVPEGQHSIVIKAVGNGLYKQKDGWSLKEFFISATATVSFTIDCTAPTVLVLPPENVSSTSAIPLNLTVNEAYSKMAYILNGQQNVTVSGNSTIPSLPAGQYNVTFYVWDTAGNIGTSKTADFTVAEISQTAETADSSLLLPVAAALSTVIIIGIVWLFKRRPSASRVYSAPKTVYFNVQTTKSFRPNKYHNNGKSCNSGCYFSFIGLL